MDKSELEKKLYGAHIDPGVKVCAMEDKGFLDEDTYTCLTPKECPFKKEERKDNSDGSIAFVPYCTRYGPPKK